MTAEPDGWLMRLARLDTGQVSDVLDEAGIPNHALSSTLIPLAPGYRFAGFAVCMRGEHIVQGGAQRPALPADALERSMCPGGVLVVESGGGTTGAILGGFVAYSLQRSGCIGIVTDSAVRDADEIRDLGLPVIAAAITPANGARRWRWTDTDVPITLPGQEGRPVPIAPGDYILADGDGVVIVPAAIAPQVIEDAEILAKIEQQISRELKSGEARADVFKRNPRFAHIRTAGATAGPPRSSIEVRREQK